MSVQVCSLLGQTEGERVQEEWGGGGGGGGGGGRRRGGGGGGGVLWGQPQEHFVVIRDENKSILLWNSNNSTHPLLFIRSP